MAPGHARRPLRPRDPLESHRPSTPLELLLDLTLVVAFSQASIGLTEAVSNGHLWRGLLAFAFTMFAACWAWVNFSWFASAFDNDDWVFRVNTMVMMLGVLILSLGIAPLFDSFVHGQRPDNRVMVLGYVIMRLPLVSLWLRVARSNPELRETARTYAITLVVAQAGWVLLTLVRPTPLVAILAGLGLLVLELTGPIKAEGKGTATPWHPHHIAERYGLLTIIGLGECVVGVVTALQAVLELAGRRWTGQVVVVGLAGVTLILAMWWVYFLIPAGDALAAARRRAPMWGYGHLVTFFSITAVGSGIHSVATFLEGHSQAGAVTTVALVAAPLGLYLLSCLGLYSLLAHQIAFLYVVLVAVALAILAAAVCAAAMGVGPLWCLTMCAAAPVSVVIGHEASTVRRPTTA